MSSIFDGLASTFVAVMGDSETARYSKADGSWSGDIRPIFDDPTLLMDGGNGRSAVARETKFHFDATCLPAGYGEGDSIGFRGKTWIVRTALPDGHGMVMMQVEAG